ncbi:MAG: HAMP domain-containing sensor histidine kinase [Gammaproteobacteria bacterium]
MEHDPKDASGGRALTDASLGEERGGVDAMIERAAANERRLLDNLVERDRHFADERLMRFRESADRVLARERSESPRLDGGIALERRVADRSKEAERESTDALLERERDRVDARSAEQRLQQNIERSENLSQRANTDERLDAERKHADVSIAALDRSEDALADARTEHTHRSEVLAMVTHELRNPLTVILANSSFIAEGTAEVATRQSANDVSRAAARMGRLLADLLDVSRIESGTFRVVKEQHDVGVLLVEVVHAYGPLFMERGVSLKVDLSDVSVVAAFDHDRVVQLLANLLGNALKFTPRTGAVELHLERHATDLELVLHDTGPGIHPHALPHVFEQFWKDDKEARRGLGLGLYICKNIAAAHGGTISVDSVVGQGATFRVSLPVD